MFVFVGGCVGVHVGVGVFVCARVFVLCVCLHV